MNHSWVWGPDNPLLEKAASLEMELSGADESQLGPLLDGWLAGLSLDPDTGHYFWGGWSVEVVARGGGSASMVFTSGGQDVAESLEHGVDTFFEQVLEPLSMGRVEWTELPLR